MKPNAVLDDFVLSLALDRKTLAAVADKSRTCRARMAIGGEPDMEDDRKFRMLPEDAALMVGNAKKRLTEAWIPWIFEHGWTSCGSKAGGQLLDVFTEGADLWCEAVLDDETWKDAVDPGIAWKGRSMGFRGWIDQDGFIRPAALLELSFTNEPAMRGLGRIETMSSFAARFAATRPAYVLGQAGLHVPAELLTKTLPTPTDSPGTASTRKEQEMKLSPENLTLLGLAADANEETTNATIAAELAKAKEKPAAAAALAAPASTPAVTPGTVAEAVTMTSAAIAEMVKSETQRQVTELRKKDKAETFVGQLARDGRIVTAQKGDAETLMLAAPEAFERFMGSVKKGSVAPTEEIAELGGDAPAFPGRERQGNPKDGYHEPELTRLTRLARERDTTVAQIAALERAN